MGKIKVCGKCGVPKLVSKEQEWLDNGVIRQKVDYASRMVFYESDNLSSLFEGIEEIVGLPIEHIVVESKRKDVKEYTGKMLSPLLRKIVRHIGFGVVAARLRNIGACYGYGAIQLGEGRRKGDDEDFQTMIIRDPHSLIFFAGEVLGAWETVDGRDSYVTYGKVDGSFKVTVHVGKHPIELSERLAGKHYPFKPGKMKFERCSSCGTPLIVARYRWDLAEGTIRHPGNGRRMMIISPAGVDAVFGDLESELGEAIPEAVVEAQRRFIRETMNEVDWKKSEEEYRSILARRGMGHISSMELDREHLSVTIQNSCMPLLMVGSMQGFFELAYGAEKTAYAWSLADDGDLAISITPA